MPMSSAEAWSKLSLDEFEDLINWILHREGFFDIRPWDESVEPDGAAILCWRTHLLGEAVGRRQCVVLSREYGKRVSRKALQEDVASVRSLAQELTIVATPSSVSAATKKWASELQEKVGSKVVIWDCDDLSFLLAHHQDLRLRLFDVPPTHDFFIKHLTDRERQFVDIDRLFHSPIIQEALVEGCRIAIQQSTLVTLAHVLIGLMRFDKGHTHKLFAEQELDPFDIAQYMESLVGRSQNKIDLKTVGLKLSSSFRSVLDTAIIITKLFDLVELQERVLLLAILMHPTSVSVNALNQLCTGEEPVILNSLVESHLSTKEVELLLAAFGPDLKALGTQGVKSLWNQFDNIDKFDDSVYETHIIPLSEVPRGKL